MKSITTPTHQERIQSAISNLANHPYTILQLADREKFHTGMLALLVKYCGRSGMSNGVFEYSPKAKEPLKIKLEESSIDLKVEQGESCWIIESKFKTGLRNDQLLSYVEKVHRTEKPRGIVVSLFPEDKDNLKAQDDGETFENKLYTREVLSALKTALQNWNEIEVAWNDQSQASDSSQSGSLSDIRVLFSLWDGYLSELKVLVEHFHSCGLHEVTWKVKSLSTGDFPKLKLTGIFVGFRFRLLKERLKKELNPSFKRLELGNTHGNALLDISLFSEDKDLSKESSFWKTGFQLQAGSLKFCIEYDKNKFDIKRDDTFRKQLLSELGGEMWQKLNPNTPSHELRVNRNGLFRSITIHEFHDLGDFEELARVVKLLTDYLLENSNRIWLAR
jgi:hypothetical protein